VLVSVLTSGETVPGPTHQVDGVLLVTTGGCTVIIDGRAGIARAGDAVIAAPGTVRALTYDSGPPCPVIAVLASPGAQTGTGRQQDPAPARPAGAPASGPAVPRRINSRECRGYRCPASEEMPDRCTRSPSSTSTPPTATTSRLPT